MMRRPLLMAAAVAVAAIPVALFSCSERESTVQRSQESLRTFNASEAVALPKMEHEPSAPPAPPPPPPMAVSGSGGNAPLPPGAGAVIPEAPPRVAYSYGYRFRVPGDALAALQERHLQLCLSMGQSSCRVVSMRRSEVQPQAQAPPRDHGYGGGQPAEPNPAASLELQVAAPLADRFGRQLTATAGESGGETVDRQIGAEDLSSNMVDVEARIRTREILIRRLSALLETRSGNIEQAIEAERAINDAQQELEAARAQVAEMRGRVAMSKIAIFYEASGAAATTVRRDPIGRALEQVSAITAQSVAVMLIIAGVSLPWVLFGILFWLLARWHRRRTEAVAP